MTETLTESFCERCGTRYTFESATPKTRLKGVKVLSRGLKNFVLSDDTSIDEAMAAARSETDRESTGHQLDAFHETFKFCMSCRQYTCPNCWNEAEQRCLSCAPLGLSQAPGALDDLALLREAVQIDAAAPANGSTIVEPEAWPATAWPEPETQPAPDVVEVAVQARIEPLAPDAPRPVEPVVWAEGAAAAATEATADTEAVDQVSKAAEQTAMLLRQFRPGQSLDAELDAYERERMEAESEAAEPSAELAPETIAPEAVTASAEPEAAVPAGVPRADSPEPEPEPEREPVAPLVEAEASQVEAEAPEPEIEQVAANSEPPLNDLVEQPTWPGAPPEAPLRKEAKPPEPVFPDPNWTATPQWPGTTDATQPTMGRSLSPLRAVEALWAASNRELASAPSAPAPVKPAASGIQPCVSCGLSLSANAKFCRRCGALQVR